MDFSDVSTIRMTESFPNEDLARVIEQAKEGNKEALGKLYSVMYDKIFRFIYYRVDHVETAEDLTEEVFIKAFASLAKFKKIESFRPWLYQISRNSVIDYYRRKKETVNIEEIENTLEYESTVISSLDLEKDQQLLMELLNELPPEQRIVIKLKFLEELDNAEISELLHKSEGAIRVMQFRALSKLKDLLSKRTNNV